MANWVRQVNVAGDIENALSEAKKALLAGLKAGSAVITLTRPKRTLEQNRLMWPLLTDISKQREHFGRRYKPEQWKDILTASFFGCTQYAPSVDGSFIVALGIKTSEWPKDTFSAFIEYLFATGAEWEIAWSKEAEDIRAEVAR